VTGDRSEWSAEFRHLRLPPRPRAGSRAGSLARRASRRADTEPANTLIPANAVRDGQGNRSHSTGTEDSED